MLTPYVMTRDLFDEFFDSAFNGHNATGMMRTDIQESAEGYTLAIDLPSVKKENLAAELKDGYLTISATISQNNEDGGQPVKYLRRERFVGSFRRSFYVGGSVKQEDIKAKYENGTLFLFVPKVTHVVQEQPRNLIAIEG